MYLCFHVLISLTASRTDTGLKSLAPPKAKTPRQKIIRKTDTPPKGNSNFLEGDFLSKQDDHLPLLMVGHVDTLLSEGIKP